MPETSTQIREYFDEVSRPILLSELEHQSKPAPWSAPGWSLAVAAAVVVVAVGVLLAWALSPGEVNPIDSPPTVTVPPDTMPQTSVPATIADEPEPGPLVEEGPGLVLGDEVVELSADQAQVLSIAHTASQLADVGVAVAGEGMGGPDGPEIPEAGAVGANIRWEEIGADGLQVDLILFDTESAASAWMMRIEEDVPRPNEGPEVEPVGVGEGSIAWSWLNRGGVEGDGYAVRQGRLVATLTHLEATDRSVVEAVFGAVVTATEVPARPVSARAVAAEPSVPSESMGASYAGTAWQLAIDDDSGSEVRMSWSYVHFETEDGFACEEELIPNGAGEPQRFDTYVDWGGVTVRHTASFGGDGWESSFASMAPGDDAVAATLEACTRFSRSIEFWGVQPILDEIQPSYGLGQVIEVDGELVVLAEPFFEFFDVDVPALSDAGLELFHEPDAFERFQPDASGDALEFVDVFVRGSATAIGEWFGVDLSPLAGQQLRARFTLQGVGPEELECTNGGNAMFDGYRRWIAIGAVAGLVGCSGQASDVAIDTEIESLENGTFAADWGELDIGCADGVWNGPEPEFGGDAYDFTGTFECADGSGTFDIDVVGEGPEPDPNAQSPHGVWELTSGTGVFAGASGGGDYTLFIDPTWSEVFEGSIRLDG